MGFTKHARLALAIGVSFASAAVWSAREASACGVFARARSEAQLAASAPYLALERVLIVWDAATQTEDFVREARFDRANQSFGFVVPVPFRPEVFAVAKEPFDDLARAFPFQPFGGMALGGIGATRAPDVLSEQRIGSFRASVLAASDGGGLETWLRQNGFAVSAAARGWLDHYVALGFYYVAFRYDGPLDARPGMTSEAVRLRFRTPTPYYPYREPVAGKARFAARNLLVWFATQEDAFSAPSDAGASGWTQPAFAVASAPSEDGVTTWKQPWAPGWRSSVTAKELRDSLPSLAEIVPGEETSRWVVVPFRDARENRDGWGDVLIPPGAPVAVNDASIAARWRLLPVLDPHLEGSPDEAPLGAASLVRPSPPTTSAHKGDASSPLPGADRFPERRASGGCALGQGATSEDGVWLVGAIAALAYVARRRRRSLAIVAVIGLSACKEDSTSAPAPWRTEAGTFVVPGGNPVFSRDGSQILVESRGTIRVHDIATGREILRFTIPSQTTDAAPTTSSRIVQMVPLPRQRLLVTTEESNPDRFLLEIDEITGDGARQRWRETIAAGEHLLNVKLAVSASGSLAMTADQSGTLRLWDLDALRELPTIVAGGRGLSHVAFAGSEYVITALQMPAPGGDRSEFHVWDLARGREERSFAGPTAFVSALATTVDGSRAVTVDSAEGLRVWDVAAGRELFGLDLSNLGDNWRAAVANPWDGTHALALRSGLVCALDVVAGAPVDCTRSPAFWWLRDPAFTPDGHLVAWSGQDSGESDIHYWRLPDRVAPGMPPTWPATPPWPTPYYEYVARLPRQAGRSAHERAVLDVMLGRVRPERIPAGAQPNTPGVSSRAIGPGRVDDGMVPPGVTVKIGEATATVPVTNAAAVLKTMRAGFRRCYVEGLNVDPTGAGRVTLSVTISPSGEVVSGEASENSGVSESVVQCVFRTVRGARFDAPGPKGSTLQVAIWFISET